MDALLGKIHAVTVQRAGKLVDKAGEHAFIMMTCVSEVNTPVTVQNIVLLLLRLKALRHV